MATNTCRTCKEYPDCSLAKFVDQKNDFAIRVGCHLWTASPDKVLSATIEREINDLIIKTWNAKEKRRTANRTERKES